MTNQTEEIIRDLRDALLSTDNLITMQKEPFSNQHSHLDSHVRSIIQKYDQ